MAGSVAEGSLGRHRPPFWQRRGQRSEGSVLLRAAQSVPGGTWSVLDFVCFVIFLVVCFYFLSGVYFVDLVCVYSVFWQKSVFGAG